MLLSLTLKWIHRSVSAKEAIEGRPFICELQLTLRFALLVDHAATVDAFVKAMLKFYWGLSCHKDLVRRQSGN